MADEPQPTTFAERRRAAVAAATERELAELRERLAEAEQALAGVPDLREAALEADRLRARLARREAELEEAFAGLRAARDARDLARRDTEAARAERDHLRGALEAMKASASWRLTAPLRRLKG
jgi:hypothetical protein